MRLCDLALLVGVLGCGVLGCGGVYEESDPSDTVRAGGKSSASASSSSSGAGGSSSGIVLLGQGTKGKPGTATLTTPVLTWGADKVLVLALFRAVGGSTNIGVTVPAASGGGLDWMRVAESCMDGCFDNSKRIDAWIATTETAGSGAVTMTSPIPADFFWSAVEYAGISTDDPVVRTVAQWPPTWWPNSRVDFSPPIADGNIGVGLFLLGGFGTLDAPAITMASPQSTAYAHRHGYVGAGSTGIQCTYPEPQVYHSAGIGLELRAP